MHILDLDEKNGVIELQIENTSDLFVLWKFLRRGDLLEASTSRKVKFESGESERIKMKLTIEVERTSFHDLLEVLRVSGRIVKGPDKFVSIGSYHTINIKIGTKLKIFRDGGFSKIDIKILEEANILSKLNPIILIAIERDEATVAILSYSKLKILGTIYQSISYKDSGMERSLKHAFFKRVLDVITDTLRSYKAISGIIIAGPGETKNQFMEYIKGKLPKDTIIILDQASSGTPAGIHEILRRGTALKISKELLVARDIADYEEFLMHLGKGDGLAIYGINDVKKAAEWGATKKILVNIDVVNSYDATTRETVLDILRMADDAKCEIRILSREHPLYEKIKNFGGIIGILRYRIHGG